VVFGEDVGKDEASSRVTEGYCKAKFRAGTGSRHAMAESVIMGSAIGMRLSGLRPIPEMQLRGLHVPGNSASSSTMQPGSEQIKIDVHQVRGGESTRSAGGVRNARAPLEAPRRSIPSSGLIVVEPSTRTTRRA